MAHMLLDSMDTDRTDSTTKPQQEGELLATKMDISQNQAPPKNLRLTRSSPSREFLQHRTDSRKGPKRTLPPSQYDHISRIAFLQV